MLSCALGGPRAGPSAPPAQPRKAEPSRRGERLPCRCCWCQGIAASCREEAGAGAGSQPSPPSLRPLSQGLSTAHPHLPDLHGATRYTNLGISGAPPGVLRLPPPAAGAGFHCGGSLSLQTLGGSCKQRQTELRGWVRTSFPIPLAAPGAAAQGTADTRRDPALSCGGEGRFLPPPVPGTLSTPRSRGHGDGTPGAQSAATPSCLAAAQALQGTGPWLQPFPSQAGLRGRAQRCGRLRSFAPAQPQPCQGGGGRCTACPSPPSPPHPPCERGGWRSAPPRPGLGRDGPEEAASLVLLPCSSHRAQVCD